MLSEFPPNAYGDRIFEAYDQMYPNFDPECIKVLSELAEPGPALELGIGTGRIALPLMETGIEVHGVDASESMLDVLRGKPGADQLQLVHADFSSFSLERRYPLIYIVFNTIFALLSQEAQLACFASAARHLTEAGHFLLEAFTPDQARFEGGQTVRVIDIDQSKVKLEATRHDPVTQTVLTQHILVGESETKLYPVKLRYIWPSEMDLMARLAGLQLVHRWGSWEKTEYRVDSPKHISLYRLAP
jgi:SAM-dependent methyltransferase